MNENAAYPELASSTKSPIAPLSKRQAVALRFIVDHIKTRGYPPTVREIGTHMDIKSTNGVNDHLRALERKGYIQRDDIKSRAMRVLVAGEVMA